MKKHFDYFCPTKIRAMRQFPKSIQKLFPQMLLVFGIVAFHIFSTIVYEPKSLCQLMSTGLGVYDNPNIFAFNLAISSAITLVVLLISRLTFYFTMRRRELTVTWYILYCTVELFFVAAFNSLYFTLLSPETTDYFVMMLRCLKSIGGLVVFPYIIHYLMYALHDSYVTSPVQEGMRLKFYDNRHLLKFITSAESVLYIESNLNYMDINYLENGVVKKFTLRNTMKNIEDLCESAGFIRTHRSFIVNPKHVKMIRKDGNGFCFADLDAEDAASVPVSKSFYGKITAAL